MMMVQATYKFEEINDIPVDELDLDPENPRFAGALGKTALQPRILDYIAESVGLKDLLSSMSHSGYYLSVPLIGVPENGRVTIVEGNRRLATAFILLGDERAATQTARAKAYPLQKGAKAKLNHLPVLIVKNRKDVLPYLGIAHIVGNKTWDSHAKAAWAVRVLDEKNLYPGGLTQIAEEIGDTNRTLERMVEAYRLVNQLIDSGRFDPSASTRKGRGSAPYPFSWVYTALSFMSIREYLSVRDRDPSNKNPVPTTKLDDAAEFLTWMFGDERKGESARINDSREIQDLAAAVTNRAQISHMRRGMSAAESKEEVRPAGSRLTDGLLAAEDSMKTVVGVLAAALNSLTEDELESIRGVARRVRDLANHVMKTVREVEDNDGASS